MNGITQFVRKSGLALVAGLLLLAGSPTQAQDAVAGKKIFEGNCAACHSLEADVVGPALKDVHKRRGNEWLVQFIKNSQAMVAAGDKDAVAIFEKFNKIPMTAFEGSLSDADINNIIAYITEASEAPSAVVAEVPAAPVAPGAQPTAAASDVAFMDLPPLVFFIIALTALVLVLVLALIYMLARLLVPMMGDSLYDEDFRESWAGRLIFLFRGDLALMTGKAKDVVHSNHDFDGIQEYDNDLPPWWKTMFYVTIVFAVGYMLHFHVLKTGALQAQEYEMEMEQAALFAALHADDPNAVTNYTVLTDQAALEAGKTIYGQNCAACHGPEGQGTVGPNLTDEYWLHGGDVNDVFKTVKYGVPSKGMVPWQGKLTKDQLLEVSSYILSLQGSNPANPKEPQGEKQ
ncbi:c-type cytochrome [Pontibacter qinzhouensis]|uniref:C-type cytochrome n=1 Tax=Pontibacter qinzhouensis TaxID=2603253 RepID=A0A5C8J8C4_9BACT|nr:c-type cytochrome [Pontibacter qinzhouensis]TXK33274.1 c-type cytochrome [Pontibacter qinzhouensis]